MSKRIDYIRYLKTKRDSLATRYFSECSRGLSLSLLNRINRLDKHLKFLEHE